MVYIFSDLLLFFLTINLQKKNSLPPQQKKIGISQIYSGVRICDCMKNDIKNRYIIFY